MRTFLVLALAAGLAAAQEIRVLSLQEPTSAFLGVSMADLNAETRGAFKVPAEVQAGIVLIEISEDSPASAAGFRAGDVITTFDGKAIKSQDDLINAVRAKKPGDKVTYVLRRRTGKIEGEVTLAKREAQRLEFVPVVPMRPEPPAPRPPLRARGDLEQRLESLDRDIAELRKKLLAARKHAAPLRHPRSLGGWIHREEQLANTARQKGDQEKYRYHAVRLSVLKEMREAEFRMPARRLERVEKKLDEVLARLDRMK